MRQDFDAARAQAPSLVFIDEIDSFPDRASVTHSWRDYVVEVVNSLLEQIDGLAGREGILIVGACNDLSRCEPALLRSGRLHRIINIGLPGPADLEKMLRVRLGLDLREADLGLISELAVGSTGADVERIVQDARRAARHASRSITLDDLRSAVADEDDRSPEMRWRSCVHEAAHILVDVHYYGPDDIFAVAVPASGKGGFSMRTNIGRQPGTYAEYQKRLQIVLAGRVAEEIVLGGGSHGAGGPAGSDLERATAIAAAMAGSFGLSGPTPLVYLGAPTESRTFLAFDEVRAAVNSELEKAAEACRELLTRERAALETIGARLFERGRIGGNEVARILSDGKVGGTPG